MRITRLVLLTLLAACLAPSWARAATELERRAATLVYRQALHADGDALALAARLLTERAARGEGAEGGALAGLRERVLAQAGVDPAAPAPRSVPGGGVDLAASLVARHAGPLREPAAPRLWAAWSQVESGEGLAGLVPYLRAEAAGSSGVIWHAALVAAADDPALEAALQPLLDELANGAAPALTASDLADVSGPGLLAASRSSLASALADPGSVDPRITARLRARWYLAGRQPAAGPAVLALSGLWIGLRDNVPDLASGRPVPFLAALLTGAQRVALGGAPSQEAVRDELERGLALLRDLPAPLAEGWSAVDTRLPEIYETVLDELARRAADAGGAPPGPSRLLLAEARLFLMDDDWEAYLMQPFREPIQQALANCFPPQGDPAGCRADFEDWALEGAAIPEASGDVGGPFEAEYLLRETELNPWQRINYLRGFWRELLARECSSRQRVSNALEWALASRAYLEVVRRGPADGNPAVLAGLGRLADAGAMLARDLDAFGGCRAQGRGPLQQVLSRYAMAVNRLASAVPDAAKAFAREVLVPGADIALDDGAGQATRYVPAELTVGPCEAAASCGVAATLPASEELYHRFPAAYRVADQSGMGSLSLCYNDVSWVERRAEPVRSGGGVMANYHGRLSFRLRGRFSTGGEVRDVFVLRFTSPVEHAYLFGPDRPEVLADPCPQEYQGLQTAGELPEHRGWLVPRRLTYLSGERDSPTRLVAENWTRGADWLSALGAGENVAVERSLPGDDIAGPVEAHLGALREMRRAFLYEHLLATVAPGGETDPVQRLTATALEMSAMRRALDAGTRVLMPRSAMRSSAFRGSLYGGTGLFGPGEIRAWREAGRDPADLPARARERLEDSASAWREHAGDTEIAPFVARTLIALLGARAEFESESLTGADAATRSDRPPTRTGSASARFR